MISDPISDLLVRIKNGGLVGKAEVAVPFSRVKEAVLKVLSEAGYIAGYEANESAGKKGLTVRLKYDHRAKHFIKGVKRVSSPGCHIYIASSEIKKLVRGRNKLGIISTSRGVISHHRAEQENLGGEFLALVW